MASGTCRGKLDAAECMQRVVIYPTFQIPTIGATILIISLYDLVCLRIYTDATA